MWLLVSLLAGAATAQETPELKDLTKLLERWPREYVRWIITEGERARYESLATEVERLEFIESFWARRDPTPETPENEYRSDYLERFAYVVNRFGAGKPGWATDRGRIYLILGPPHSIQQNPMGRFSLERPSEIWTYNGLGIPGVPESIDITFVDFKSTGDFEIVSDLELTAPVDTQFGPAESGLLALAMRRNRMGYQDPRTGLDTFREVDPSRLVMREFDMQQQLLAIEDAPRRSLESLRESVAVRASFRPLTLLATAGAIRGRAGKVKVPVSLAVPYSELSFQRREGSVVYRVDYLIRLVDASGSEAASAGDRLTLTFPEEQQVTLPSLRLAVEDSLEVSPGAYKLQAYLRDNVEEKLGSVEETVEARGDEIDGLRLSSLFVASVVSDATAGSGGPFQFGAVRVVPSPERSFSSDQSLSLYLQAYGAAAGDGGRKRLKVEFFVMRQERLFLGIPSTYLFPDTEPIGIRAAIPLVKCPPGDYGIRVRVTDEVAARQATAESTFRVVPEASTR
jgi:GWxTD domain-containing protein